ncbi:hypothetical protein [Streptacidiphilus sp. EB103A]
MTARTVLPASPQSFCAGVERAIAAVEAALDAAPVGSPVYFALPKQVRTR